MEERIARLEAGMQDVRERVARIETKLDTFPDIFATKADMHREFNGQTWKLVGAMVGIAGAVIAITRTLG